MNFLRLNDFLLSTLFEDDEIIAIDKPYGVNTHTNDSKIGHSDFIQDGLIEIFEKQLGQKLHIVHRLDQTTTGVIIFAKSAEAAKKYAEFFFDRKVKKTYWFITDQKIKADHFLINKIIIHKAKELEAETQFTHLKSSAKFSLWQANPHTGRNHQIRIHAQAAGISILGDPKYEGTEYPFLCLHNHQIEFPNGLVIKSKAPRYFQDLNLLENQMLARVLFEVDRRVRIFSHPDFKNQCLRLAHARDIGLTLDQYGEVLLLSWYKEHWGESEVQSFSYLAQALDKPIVVRLMHNRGKDPINKSQFVLKPKTEDAEIGSTWIAGENKVKYEIRTDSGQSLGLFLDQRIQRHWVLANTQNKTVLNLFSYTCGFSLVSALGGAAQVTSVDTAKTVLNWGRKNFEINGLDPEKHKFFLRDSLNYLDQCLNKNIKYDLIICDPPSFSRGEKGVFKIQTSLEPLLKICLSCLNPGGQLLFSTNYEEFFVDDIRKTLLKVQKDLKLAVLEVGCIQSALDFELPDQRALLKSFLIQLGVVAHEIGFLRYF